MAVVPFGFFAAGRISSVPPIRVRDSPPLSIGWREGRGERSPDACSRGWPFSLSPSDGVARGEGPSSGVFPVRVLRLHTSETECDSIFHDRRARSLDGERANPTGNCAGSSSVELPCERRKIILQITRGFGTR